MLNAHVRTRGFIWGREKTRSYLAVNFFLFYRCSVAWTRGKNVSDFLNSFCRVAANLRVKFRRQARGGVIFFLLIIDLFMLFVEQAIGSLPIARSNWLLLFSKLYEKVKRLQPLLFCVTGLCYLKIIEKSYYWPVINCTTLYMFCDLKKISSNFYY